jgi:glc operon protein GlcG
MRPVLTIFAFTAALFAAGPVGAQTAPAAQSAENGTPEDMPYATPYGAPITGDRAERIVAAALAEAAKHPSWQFSIAVVDTTGELVYFYRMPNAALSSPRNSQNKAVTSVRYRRATQVFYEAAKAGNNPNALDPAIVASLGGFPIVENGKIIGAIGCSGGTGAQDTDVCQAGMAALK